MYATRDGIATLSTESTVNKISFCIPSKNNLRYLKVAISYLRQHCDPSHEILVWVDKDEDNASEYLQNLNDPNLRYWVNQNPEPFGIGNAYDYLVSHASNDLVMMYHADMIAGADMDIEVLRHHALGTVVCATRIEPPLHPGEPCKITKDFGLWPEEDVKDGFKVHEFNQKVMEWKTLYADKTTPGVFAPWLIHKLDYQRVGGHDPKLNSLAEDNDIFNRMLLAEITFCQSWSALVYHLTCRGGQFEHASTTEQLGTKSDDWNLLSYQKTREFIRKWGFPPMSGPLKEPIVWPSKRIHAETTGWKLSQDMYILLQFLEPYFASLTIDDLELQQLYIQKEQEHTSCDLGTKFTKATELSAVISFDVARVTNQHLLEVLSRLPLILDQVTEAGLYEFDIFIVEVF